MHGMRGRFIHGALGYAAAGAVACGLLLLVGCTQSVTVTATKNVGSSGGSIGVTYQVKWVAEGSYLQDLEAQQALLNLSLSNATISSATGDATVTVTDTSTGATLGQQSFGWTVSGTSIYALDPTAVQDWLGQFVANPNVSVNVQVAPTLQASDYGSASVTGTAEYQGTSYASTTTSWDYTKMKNCIPGTQCTQ